MIADLFPPKRLGRALGVYSSGVFFGAGIVLLTVDRDAPKAVKRLRLVGADGVCPQSAAPPLFVTRSMEWDRLARCAS